MSYVSRFEQQSGVYAAHRPRYEPVLYEWLASLAPRRALAWDCATGSGQAALGLAEPFARVIATDASRAQLAAATAHPRIAYLQATAESPPFAGVAFDIVTVAQAAHWFDFDRFNATVRRVLRLGGVVALWTYFTYECHPPVDELVWRFYGDVLGPYWDGPRQHVEARYQTVPFPFREVAPPQRFDAVATWDFSGALGYVESWSAVQNYRRQTGRDPMELIRDDLRRAWGDPGLRRTVRWPLALRVGHV